MRTQNKEFERFREDRSFFVSLYGQVRAGFDFVRFIPNPDLVRGCLYGILRDVILTKRGLYDERPEKSKTRFA